MLANRLRTEEDTAAGSKQGPNRGVAGRPGIYNDRKSPVTAWRNMKRSKKS